MFPHTMIYHFAIIMKNILLKTSTRHAIYQMDNECGAHSAVGLHGEQW